MLVVRGKGKGRRNRELTTFESISSSLPSLQTVTMSALIDQIKSQLEGQIVRRPPPLLLESALTSFTSHSQDFQGQKTTELVSQVGIAGSAVRLFLFPCSHSEADSNSSSYA